MKWILILLATLVPTFGANTINASTVHRADVQSAYDSAIDGDTVVIPAGTANWTNGLTISKAITVIGAGIGNTVIVDDIPTGQTGVNQALFNVQSTLGKVYRISGIEMRVGARTTGFISGCIQLHGTSQQVRIDHCKFDRIKNAGIYVFAAVWGVADHNEWYFTTGHSFALSQSTQFGGTGGRGSWENAITPGSAEAFYFEDNIFTGDDSDGFRGGRGVVRFNTFTNSLLHTHGLESTGNARAFRWIEIYGNTLHHINYDSREFVDWRDGGGLVASNTVNKIGGPSPWSPMGLNAYRLFLAATYWGGADGTNPLDSNSPSIFETGTVTTGSGASGIAARTMTDNTKTWTPNEWRGYTLRNMSSNYTTAYPFTSNYFALIQSNSATTITYYENPVSAKMRFAAGNAYEIRKVIYALDQPGSGTSDPIDFNITQYDPGDSNAHWLNQPRETIYQWSNTVNGVLWTINPLVGYLIEGRDYTNNVPHPTWTPYTYPHPLIGITEGTGPDPLITVQPQSQTIDSGETATMSVTATGTGPFTYQWYNGSSPDDESPIGGATSDDYTTPALFVTQSFWVRVMGAEGTADSATATITITGDLPPTITDEPDNQTIFSGQTAFLSVTATGTGDLTYQWYQGASGATGSPISSATNANYTTPALTSTTQYWVRVTNLVGTDDSTTATITVVPAPPNPPSPNGIGRLTKRPRR